MFMKSMVDASKKLTSLIEKRHKLTAEIRDVGYKAIDDKSSSIATKTDEIKKLKAEKTHIEELLSNL